MKTRDEFVRRWKCHLAGLALFGRYSEERDGLATRAAKILEIPAEVERLLGQMYADLTSDDAPNNGTPRPSVNGTHNTRGKT